MKRIAWLLCGLAFLWCTDAQARDIREMVKTIQQPIAIQSSSSPRLSVEFAHSQHKGINCMLCHHKVGNEGRYVACTTCHNVQGRKDRSPQSTFMAFHAKKDQRSCMGCHIQLAEDVNSKYFLKFRGCRPCHTGPINREAKQAAAVEVK